MCEEEIVIICCIAYLILVLVVVEIIVFSIRKNYRVEFDLKSNSKTKAYLLNSAQCRMELWSFFNKNFGIDFTSNEIDLIINKVDEISKE